MATRENVGARRALLVAAATYVDSGFARLRAPIVDALASVLEDPTLGGFELRRLVNVPTEQIKREIEGFVDDARLNDLLLLYMSGHAAVDDQHNRPRSAVLHHVADEAVLDRRCAQAFGQVARPRLELGTPRFSVVWSLVPKSDGAGSRRSPSRCR